MRKKNVTELTRRELEILQLIGSGLSTQDVASRIHLSPNTVSTHRKNILRKTGAKSLIAVIMLGIQMKVISLDAIPE